MPFLPHTEAALRALSGRGSLEISEEEALSLLLQPTEAASGGSLDLSRRNTAATSTGAASRALRRMPRKNNRASDCKTLASLSQDGQLQLGNRLARARASL